MLHFVPVVNKRGSRSDIQASAVALPVSGCHQTGDVIIPVRDSHQSMAYFIYRDKDRRTDLSTSSRAFMSCRMTSAVRELLLMWMSATLPSFSISIADIQFEIVVGFFTRAPTRTQYIHTIILTQIKYSHAHSVGISIKSANLYWAEAPSPIKVCRFDRYTNRVGVAVFD